MPHTPEPENGEGGEDEARGEIVKAQWSGPLPPPAHLEELERILPGAAETIFAQFENEANHRRALERENARFASRDAAVGQALAGLYAAFSLTGFAIYTSATCVAAILGGGTIVSGVIAFLRRAK